MKINEAVKISLIAAILIIVLSVAYYFVILSPKTNTATGTDIVDNTLNCNELYELKKTKYWGDEIGQSKAIYNDDLDTCLALNIYDYSQIDSTDRYDAMIVDLSDDLILMHYSVEPSVTPQFFYVEGDEIITCQNNYIYFEFVQNGQKGKPIIEHGCDTDEEGIPTDKVNLFGKMFEKIRDFGFQF